MVSCAVDSAVEDPRRVCDGSAEATERWRLAGWLVGVWRAGGWAPRRVGCGGAPPPGQPARTPAFHCSRTDAHSCEALSGALSHDPPIDLLLPRVFQQGEKVPKADEGALEIRRMRALRVLRMAAHQIPGDGFAPGNAPSSGFATFSPAEKRGGQGARLELPRSAASVSASTFPPARASLLDTAPHLL
jgi:hypothetical protein